MRRRGAGGSGCAGGCPLSRSAGEGGPRAGACSAGRTECADCTGAAGGRRPAHAMGRMPGAGASSCTHHAAAPPRTGTLPTRRCPRRRGRRPPSRLPRAPPPLHGAPRRQAPRSRSICCPAGQRAEGGGEGGAARVGQQQAAASRAGFPARRHSAVRARAAASHPPRAPRCAAPFAPYTHALRPPALPAATPTPAPPILTPHTPPPPHPVPPHLVYRLHHRVRQHRAVSRAHHHHRQLLHKGRPPAQRREGVGVYGGSGVAGGGRGRGGGPAPLRCPAHPADPCPRPTPPS